jgi:hypothetical protein
MLFAPQFENSQGVTELCICGVGGYLGQDTFLVVKIYLGRDALVREFYLLRKS